MRLSADDFPEVAVAAMHAVHLEEVDMINAIYEMLEAIEAGAGQDGLAGKLEELLDHTREHFVAEEVLMDQHHFPPAPVHKAAHDAFLHDMEQMVSGWKADQALAPVAQFMRNDLPTWMVEHISTMDFVTARFVAMQPQS